MRPRDSGDANGRRPVRVVHLVTTLAIGGLEKVVLDLVRFGTPDQFTMRVVCVDESGVLRRETEHGRRELIDYSVASIAPELT